MFRLYLFKNIFEQLCNPRLFSWAYDDLSDKSSRIKSNHHPKNTGFFF